MPVSSVTSNPHASCASGTHVRFRFKSAINTPLETLELPLQFIADF